MIEKTNVIMFYQSQIYMVFDHNKFRPLCQVSKYIYGTERTMVEMYTFFCYIIDPLNLSDFKVNLIADSDKLQFCWKLNFLLQKRCSCTISLPD